jgi:hypothetical protein
MGSDGLNALHCQKEAAMLSRAESRFLAELAALRQRMEKAHLKETVNIERAIGRLSTRSATNQSAEGAAPKAPSPPIVNNFARCKMLVGDKLSQSVSIDGGNASDGTRSCYDHVKTVRWCRTPVRSQVSIASSDKTKVHEALRTQLDPR